MVAWRPKSEDAQAVLAETVARFGSRAALSCSFGGAGGMVLIDMLSRLNAKIPVIFLDTGFLFPETLALRDAIAKRYELEILTYKPGLTAEAQAATFGERLWERDPDRCCQLRKVLPMHTAICELQLEAWITALRRDQSPTRSRIETVQYEEVVPGRRIVKVSPLAGWTRRDVWAYIHRHKVPYNPLLDRGYSSLGCVQCTAASQGEDERAGRWPGRQKTECGLHTATVKRLPDAKS